MHYYFFFFFTFELAVRLKPPHINSEVNCFSEPVLSRGVGLFGMFIGCNHLRPVSQTQLSLLLIEFVTHMYC